MVRWYACDMFDFVIRCVRLGHKVDLTVCVFVLFCRWAFEYTGSTLLG